MKKVIQLILFGTVFLFSGCGVLESDDKTFDAGPILFISDESGTNQLYSMDEDGNNITQLTNDPNFPIYEAKWSPDGQKIAVISEVGDSNDYSEYRRAVFIMDADGSNRYQLTPQWITVQDSVRGALNYAGALGITWKPNSKKIIFSRLMAPESFGNYDVFLINLDGTNEKRITKTIDLTEGTYDWSSDSDAFWGVVVDYSAQDSSGQGIQYTRLVLVDLDGEILKSWGEPGEKWQHPAYSQSESKIAYIYVNKSQNRDVYIINSDGTRRSNLTNGMCQFSAPIAWSQDNKQILLDCYNQNADGHRIFIINADGTGVKNITPFKDVFLQAQSWRR
ncbi:TolB family protein [Gracilimonas sp.]|uniref:TolB family protein n=1 Tax=Gracilimonas sp. TaxID=1974203 RepID=UPI0028725727|nr:hypothetical protein [Gracilimonas sp.]